MKIKFDLPKRYETIDFHEFSYLEDHLKTVVSKAVNVHEVGWNGQKYVGIVYVGKLTDSNNRKLYRNTKKEIVGG